MDNLEKMTIQDVYYKGRKIDQDGEIIVKECPSELKNTVHVGEFSKEELAAGISGWYIQCSSECRKVKLQLSVKMYRYFMKWEYSPAR